ncbi:MAG TPA: bacillithiol biosynthesis deacetylase BshB1 [candidate division Zixibacteria bacterium]|nr:bacillithiol biosynthesis deacetylase BshB1 [candidate division Zixibacteria bacterium]
MSEKYFDVLAVGSHPDDVEVGCGGVLARSRDRGHSAAIVILTKGEMGTGGTVEIRERETADAAKIMGAEVVAQFDWGDTQLVDTYEHRKELAAVIRQTRPRIVLCPYPHIGNARAQCHPDHVASGQIAINAVSLANLQKFDCGYPPHQVERVFHYFLPYGVKPTFVIDITDYYDTWVASLKAHASQFQNPEKDADYIFYLETMSRAYGQMARCKFGQGYLAQEPLLIDDLMDLVKAQPSVVTKKEHLRR